MKNVRGLALDKFLELTPDDVYKPCPCGCGKAFRYALRDGAETHQEKFVANFVATYQEKVQSVDMKKEIAMHEEVFDEPSIEEVPADVFGPPYYETITGDESDAQATQEESR